MESEQIPWAALEVASAWDALPRRAAGLPFSPHSDFSKREAILDQLIQQPTPQILCVPLSYST